MIKQELILNEIKIIGEKKNIREPSNLGGTSGKEVSLNSGRACINALKKII